MDSEDRDDRSENKDRLQRTGEKMRMNEDPLIESQYVMNQQSKEEEERNSRLDQIEAEIKQVGKRLQQIQQESRQETDQYSERYMELEGQRTSLKKRLIDLDYHHKVWISNSIRESRRREADEKEKIVKEAEEKREKRLRELEQKRESRSTRKEQNEESSKAEGENSQNQGEKRKQQQGEDELARSRRKVRIAEIEAELAQSRLRRSRMASLNAELDYLRATYSYPYWRDYYPSSLYPYYPYTSLYPYTSPYLPVYPSFSRYRWWL